ncbi:hypothetical protein ACHQM5_004808 [Ranunculus cassubicifolius]
MAEIGTLDIHGEIQSLVSDKLQVVSYKWLSRNFSVSSNDAKRILQEFVEQNGSGLEIVYSLAGQLKKGAPSSYHIQFVSGAKLAEVKNQFEDDCSVQVYSVQACIPKDPAVLWNSEFIQGEELFDQPSSEDNCLRDNRFCGVKNSFVKRDNTGTAFVSRSKSSPQTPIIPEQKVKIGQASAKTVPSPAVASPVVKIEPRAKSVPSPAVPSPVVKTENKVSNISPQPYANVGKDAAAVPAAKKKAQNGKSPSVAGGSLANMWGRASVKPKPTSPPETKDKEAPIPIENLATADAQICLREERETVSDDDDDDDDMGVNRKRASNGEGKRKRQVIFDDSDEDDFEGAVNLASPDPPKIMSTPKPEILLEKNTLNFEDQNEESPKIEKRVAKVPKLVPKEENVIASKEETSKIEKRVGKVPELEPKEENVIASKDETSGKSAKSPDTVNSAHRKDKATGEASSKPTRRKVCKTRIDERGNEVFEVVWEGEEIENKDADKKDTVVTETANTPPPAPPVAATANKKSPAFTNNAGSKPAAKGGPKKTGKGAVVKDAKQGNIMSFFKKA